MEDKPLNPFDDTYIEVRLKRSPPPSPEKPEPEGGVGVLLIILLGLLAAAAIAFSRPLDRSQGGSEAEIQPVPAQPIPGVQNSLLDNRSPNSNAVGGDSYSGNPEYIGDEEMEQRIADGFEPPPPQVAPDEAIDSSNDPFQPDPLQRSFNTNEVTRVSLKDSSEPELSGIKRVGNCEADGANFRRSPSMTGTILGVIPEGDEVQLTGEREVVNGREWYEAININPLRPSADLRAINQLDINQTGWIHGCYFSYLRDR